VPGPPIQVINVEAKDREVGRFERSIGSRKRISETILVVHRQEEGVSVMDKTVKEVAIYVEAERVAEVTRVLPLPFHVAPFPFLDPPSGPRTSVLRYIGEWTDEQQQIARRLVHARVIRQVSSHWSHLQERQSGEEAQEE
jgi:hypothetical protein